jgi:ABC-2 type transport system ATP-binding protein
LGETVISTRELTKHYGHTVGVEGLDLEVYRGELFGFLGPNGAGKTTTMRLLMGMLKPTGGSASVLGHDSWKESVSVNELVGYLPGDARLYDGLTGNETIAFISRFNNVRAETGIALADRFELDLSRKVAGYSRGMKQKLALILSLMKKPPLLIMDEPTNALDPLMQHQLYRVLREYKEEGTTVMFSSHNLPEVERIADRVGVIRKGHLVGTERIEDLRNKRLRNVDVFFSDRIPDELKSLQGVTDYEAVSKSRVQLKFKGEMNPLIRLLAKCAVSDFSVSHASLEDMFMEFYGSDRRGAREGTVEEGREEPGSMLDPGEGEGGRS